MKSHEIREKFLNYFADQGHLQLPSSSLIPTDDPTLLFTNAGMNQFKNVFLGQEKAQHSRAATSQKCVRAGGKHNDLENVGHTARHHTFFEMLGNFSFGDYFKKDAIHYAWHFVTKELGLPKDKLYVTVFEQDEESAEIWAKQERVPSERIFRFGEKDNFWRMGDVGPCGPCSEIFYDLGPEVGGRPEDNVMGGPGDRYIEFWNLVFMEFYEDGQTRQKLPRPSIDTGMGLERLTTILQGQISNYHTDLFVDLMNVGEKVSRHQYDKDLKLGQWVAGSAESKQNETNVALRVLSDHARASAFLLADGVLPSNEGRGYVLRRILRRAIRYGRKLSETNSLLLPMAEKVIEKMSPYYPELSQQQSLILKTVRDEEQRFLTTLDQGTEMLNEELRQLSIERSTRLSGEVLFKLYDTFGFPVDLTRVIATEQGFEVDEQGFEAAMSKARLQAKASWKGALSGAQENFMQRWTQALESAKIPKTQFKGYDQLMLEGALVLSLSNGEEQVDRLTAGQTGFIVFKQTNFYAESGGQVGDSGEIKSLTGRALIKDCRTVSGFFLHEIEVTEGTIEKNQLFQLQVNESVRRATASNHSATHLLHAALRSVLGDHVRQAGSLVSADRLRFDFTHSQPVTEQEIEQIEHLINQQIANNSAVIVKEMSFNQAVEQGAMALFGEKYGDLVRVVQMGEFSTELCGGTHVGSLSQIRLVKIVGESGLSAGVRRIEALTSQMALQFLNAQYKENSKVKLALGLNESWENALSLERDQELPPVLTWIEKQRAEMKELKRMLKEQKSQSIDANQIFEAREIFKLGGQSIGFIFTEVALDDRKLLSELLDHLKDRLKTGIVVLCGQGEESHPLLVGVTKDLVSTWAAGNLLKSLTQVLGGKGGGRPDFAQGAIIDRTKLSDAKKALSQILIS